MSYLANYEQDIFVSYAHGPTRPGFAGTSEDRLGRWSRLLVDDLAEEILFSLSTKVPGRQLEVWMDPELGGNQPLSDTLKEKIEHSALLLVIMSDFFLESQWCLAEVEWFRQACARRGESARNRIFVVRAVPTIQTAWPAALCDSSGHPLIGYPFHSVPKTVSDEPRPFGWPEPHAADMDYANALKRVSADMVRQLRSPDMVRHEKHAPPPPVKDRSVFLACMHDTVDEERAELRDMLTASGITVLPPEEDDPVDESSLQEVFEKYLPRADAMMLIANEYRGAWPRDQPGGFVSLQIQEAQRLHKPCAVWLQVADIARVRKPEYRQYLETLVHKADADGVTIRHDGVQGFADHLIEKLATTTATLDTSPDPGDAVICANRPEDEALGRDFLEAIKTTLSELQQESFTFDFADPEEERIKLTNLEKRIRKASTVLVLCFDQDWDWARPFLRLLNGMGHVRGDDKVRLLVAGPRDRKEARYDARALGFPTVDGVDKDHQQLKVMLRQAIQAAAPRGGLQTVAPPGS